MRLIEPNVELWSEENVTPEQHIARCARVCYGHTGEGRDPKRMVEGLIKNGHRSMLRHATKYIRYNNVHDDQAAFWMDVCPYNQVCQICDKRGRNKFLYVAVNRQELIGSDNFNYVGYDAEYSLQEFLQLCQDNKELFQIVRLTFCLTTQISTSRELNRVSPNNIAERSTRYCSSKDGITICRPHWMLGDLHEITLMDIANAPFPAKPFLVAWHEAEEEYKRAIAYGMKPEDARGLLPLDAATQVVYTYSVREWEHILALRYYEKTGKAHPNAKLIMGMVRDQINQFAKEHNIDYQV